MTENGGPDTGLASAGRAALATDGTTLASNPAGLARLDGPGFVAVAQPVVVDLEFRGTGATEGRATSESDITPMAAIFVTGGSGAWTYGFGAYGNVGLGCDFGRDWSGRRSIEDARLGTLNLAPALAVRLTERIDVGASLGAQYATAEAALSVGNDAAFYGPPVGLPDGQLRVSGRSWAPVANLGLAYRADGGSTVGVAWTSAVAHSIDLDASANALHPMLGAMLHAQGPAELEFALPQQVTASVTQPLGERTLLAASAGWQQWSRFGEADLRFAGRAAPMFEYGLEDTWSVALGARHRLDRRWTLSAGLAYDSDPAGGGPMPVYFPVAEQLRVAAGADFAASESLRLRAALSVINQGDIRVSQQTHPLPLPGIPPVTGRIDGSRIYVASLTADYRL
jgi:long-chain fatty acid transport protein